MNLASYINLSSCHAVNVIARARSVSFVLISALLTRNKNERERVCPLMSLAAYRILYSTATVMQPLQPSPRASALIQSLITKMEDEARVHDEPPGQQQQQQQQQQQRETPMPPPPSNREIEEVIKNAMALASRGGVSREGSRAGSPEGLRGSAEGFQHGQQQFQQGPNPHQPLPHSHLPHSHQHSYNGFMNPQVQMGMGMGMGHAAMGMGPAPSMQSFHPYPKPVSLPLFSESRILGNGSS